MDWVANQRQARGRGGSYPICKQMRVVTNADVVICDSFLMKDERNTGDIELGMADLLGRMPMRLIIAGEIA